MTDRNSLDGDSRALAWVIGFACGLSLLAGLLVKCGPGFVDDGCASPTRVYEPDGAYVLSYDCEAVK